MRRTARPFHDILVGDVEAGLAVRQSRCKAARPAARGHSPFGPPIGSTEPAIAAAGSVVGKPSASIAQPSGMVSPLTCDWRMRERAAIDVAMSSTIGARPSIGMPAPIGFVPSSASTPASRCDRRRGIGEGKRDQAARRRAVAPVACRAKMAAVVALLPRRARELLRHIASHVKCLPSGDQARARCPRR